MKDSIPWPSLLKVIDHFEVNLAHRYTCVAPLFGEPHRHPLTFHFTYVLSGCGTFVVEGTSHQAQPGTAIFIRPGQLHSSLDDSRTAYELIDVKFSTNERRIARFVPRYPVSYQAADLSAGSALQALRRDPAHAVDFLEKNRDRLLFGRDTYGTDLRDFLTTLPLEADTVEQIFHLNASRLIPA